MDFANFPVEIKCLIFDLLTSHELENKVVNVCQEWRELINSPYLRRRLCINGSEKKEEKIQLFHKCCRIRELSIHYVAKWDWFMDLKRHSRLQLRQIHFSFCHIDCNSAIRHLVQCCPFVNELTITNCPDYSSFTEITRWKHLKSLKFDFGGGKSFDDIAENCNVLEKLHATVIPDVANNHCNSAFLRLINTRGHNLKSLHLISHRDLQNSAFEALNQCNQLTYLCIDSVWMLDSGLMALKELHQLRTLILHEAKNISRQGFTNLFRNSHFPNLTLLMLCSCANFTDFSIRAVSFSCPVLKRFTLVRNNLVTDEGIQYVIDNCKKNLEYLHFHTLSRLTGKFLKDIFTQCLKLQHLTISKCQRIPTEILSRLKECHPTQMKH